MRESKDDGIRLVGLAAKVREICAGTAERCRAKLQGYLFSWVDVIVNLGGFCVKFLLSRFKSFRSVVRIPNKFFGNIKENFGSKGRPL